MKYFLLSLRFVFGFLSVMLSLGLIRTVFLYASNGGEIGMINFNLILQFAFFLAISIGLTVLFSSIYDRKGFHDDRLIRKEDLAPGNTRILRKEDVKPEREVY